MLRQAQANECNRPGALRGGQALRRDGVARDPAGVCAGQARSAPILPATRQIKSSNSTVLLISAVAVWVAAFALRMIRSDTVFRSLDYADLPFRVAHFWGWGWMLDNAYGPVQPVLTKLWAMLATSLGFAMTEPMWHVPPAVVGSTTPLLAYVFMRELKQDRAAAAMAAVWLCIAPLLVSSDRYTYSAETFGLFFTVATLIAVCRHARQPTAWTAWCVGISGAAVLLSHLLFYALPMVVAYLIYAINSAAVRNGSVARRRGTGERPVRHTRIWLRGPIVVPPLVAVGIMAIGLCTGGGGQLGHLIFKRGVATTGVARPDDLAQHGIWLLRQFGWIAGALLLPALAFGVREAWRRRRAGVFAVWTVAFLAPLVLGQQYYGRMYGYYVQACFALTCLGAGAWSRLLDGRFRRAAVLIAVAVSAQLLAGTASTVFANDRACAWTGVMSPIGATTPDPGYRAAGWYVRTHVPADAVVFTPHDVRGLEYLNAAFYMGRPCLAGENLSHEQMRRVYEAFAARIDAAVIEPAFDDWFSTDSSWRRVAQVMDGGRVLLRVYRKNPGGRPVLDLPLDQYNGRFDAECAPRVIPELQAENPRIPSGRAIAAAARGEAVP